MGKRILSKEIMYQHSRNNKMTDQVKCFTFGEMETLNQNVLLTSLYSSWNSQYWEPPIPFLKLLELQRQQTHHESAIDFKCNVISSLFKSNKHLSYGDFEKMFLDYLILGNAFLVVNRNRGGGVISLNHILAKVVRVGKNGDFYQIKDNTVEKIDHEILHIKKYDANQNIYGMPSYLSALLSIELNKAATLFRVKYYLNGSHAGFILSINGAMSEDSLASIEKQLKASKGDGNFKNMLVHMPNGDKDSIKLTPISEVTARDEFLNIKNCTRDDIAAAHRVPLVLMSIQPTNAGGFGNPNDHALVFNTNEIQPITKKIRSLNDELGVIAFDFDKYELA